MGTMMAREGASMACTKAVVDRVSRAAFVFSLGSARAASRTSEMAEISGLRTTLPMSCGAGTTRHAGDAVHTNTWAQGANELNLGLVAESARHRGGRVRERGSRTMSASRDAAWILGWVSVKHSHSLGTIWGRQDDSWAGAQYLHGTT